MTRQLIARARPSNRRSVIPAPWSLAIGCLFRGQPASTTQLCRFQTAFSRKPNSAWKIFVSALRQAGSSLEDVVRVTYVLPNGADFAQCWPVLRKYFGAVRPAAMMISAGLADPRIKIEIEVTARKRS